MFSTKYIKFVIIAAAAAVAAGCTHIPDTDIPEPDSETEQASLTIDFSIADLGIGVETRAGEGTVTGIGLSPEVIKQLDPDDTGPMSDEAAFIDGCKMSCLTVLLINKKENRIVGIREVGTIHPSENHQNVNAEGNENGFLDANGEIDPDATSGTRARVTFNYNAPIHVAENGKSAERLLRGEYRLFAIANYDHTVPTSKGNPTTDGGTATEGGTTTGGEYETINLKTTLDGIVDKFHADPGDGIHDFNPQYEYFYNIRFLMNRTIKGKDKVDIITEDGTENGKQIRPYIRPATNQTLSATQNIYLTTGQNHVSVELLRISSRTRVEVKNYSTEPLHVHSLEFCNNYTQSTNYLFRREDDDRNYEHFGKYDGNYKNLEEIYYKYDTPDPDTKDFKGAPDVSFNGIAGGPTTGAIVPFEKGKNDVVPAGKKMCIFDALMYESYDPDKPFTYTIDVSYPGVTDYKTTDPNKIDREKSYKIDWGGGGYEYALTGDEQQYITDITSAEDVYQAIQKIKENYKETYKGTDQPPQGQETCYFLIRGVQTDKFLCEKDDGTLWAEETKVLLSADNITSYLWTLEDLQAVDGNYSCYLTNARSKKHMPTLPQDAGGMTSTDDKTCQKYKLGVNNNNVTFSNSFVGAAHPAYYLSIYANGPNLGGWHEADPGCQYRLYPVVLLPLYTNATPRFKKTVTLTTFSDETAVVEEVHEIQRNDFVRILVEVSYNPDKSEFVFEAKPWETGGGGSVEFN